MRTSSDRLHCSLRYAVLVCVLIVASPMVFADGGGWCPWPGPVPPPETPKPAGPQCSCEFCQGSPCYSRSGAYVTGATDLTLPTAGLPLTVTRKYLSSQTVDVGLGIGWRLGLSARLYYATYLFAAPSTYSKLASVVLPDGNVQTFTQNSDGSFTAPNGTSNALVLNGDGTFDLFVRPGGDVYRFASDGVVLWTKDRYGNQLNFTYDGSRRLQQIADGAGSGRYINVFWGGNGRVSSVQDSAGRQVQYGYDTQGRLTSVIDPANRTTYYDYVTGRFGGVLSGIRDNWNRPITAITYDAAGRTATYTENGETYTYTYSYQGDANKTAKTDSAGKIWVFVTSPNLLITDRIPPTGAGGGTVHSDFDSNLRLQQLTDEAGVKTYYTYDGIGNVSSVTRDYQGTLAVRYDYAYDPTYTDRVVSITPKNPSTNLVDPNWQAWQYEYWQAGDPAPGALKTVKRVHDDGTTTDTVASYVYDAHGRVTRQTTATGAQTDYAYDGATGNLLTVTAPSNNDAATRPVTTYSNFDGVGRPLTVTDPNGKSTTYTYDALGRVLTVTLPKPSPGSPLTFATTYGYDNWDVATQLVFTNITDPNSKLTKMGYDQFGRLVKSVDASNNTTAYAYTKDLLTSITDANNNVTGYQYNALRRLTKTTFPDSAFETYTYTPDGLLWTKTDRKNQTLTYAYDALKRLKTKTYPGSIPVTYTYTGQKLTQVVDTYANPDETHGFTYDGSYRVASNTQGPRGTVSYTYTADDRVATMSIQGGSSATYAYYPDGSMNTLTWSPVSGNFKYVYTLPGQYQSVTFPNGQVRGYGYDDQGRLLSLSNTLGATNLATFAYGYDVDNQTGQSTMLGQRTSMTATVPPQGLNNALSKYYYDPLYQLTRTDYPSGAPFNGEVHQWTYDAIGNRLTNTVNSTTQTYAYFKNGANPLNGQRLSSDGVNAYTWDANGSDLTRNGAPGNFTFGYDVDNRQASISGATTASYTYDYQGRRAGKTVSGVTSTYLYDGLNLVRETVGGTPAEYAFGPGIDEPLAQYRSGTISYFDADALGTVAVTNDPAGNATLSTTFDAWGVTRNETGTRYQPFTYTGREVAEAGLLFYRARFLQTGVGRFTQEDPIRLEGTGSYYYAVNAPVVFRDPEGLCPWQVRHRPTRGVPSDNPDYYHWYFLNRENGTSIGLVPTRFPWGTVPGTWGTKDRPDNFSDSMLLPIPDEKCDCIDEQLRPPKKPPKYCIRPHGHVNPRTPPPIDECQNCQTWARNVLRACGLDLGAN
jgi:RHS repeat-associated protein